MGGKVIEVLKEVLANGMVLVAVGGVGFKAKLIFKMRRALTTGLLTGCIVLNYKEKAHNELVQVWRCNCLQFVYF